MKCKSVIVLTILPMLLASCTDGVGNKTFFIDRTEEVNFSFEDDTDAYVNHAYYKNWDEIKPQLEMGVGMLVILTQVTCGHCTRFKNTFIDYCKLNSIAYGVIENSGKTYETYQEYHKQVDDMNEFYGYKEGDENYIAAATPSVLGLNKSKGFEMIGGAVTSSRLTAELKRFVTYTNIYHTRTFSITSEDNLKYILNTDDSNSVSFYENELYPLAKKSKKRVDIIDYNLMDEEDRVSLFEAYSLTSYEPLLMLGDKSVNTKNDPDNAKSLIASYL